MSVYNLVGPLKWPALKRLCDAVDEVLYAAQALRSAQHPPQFKVVPQLHRLNAAVAAWEVAVVECELDSDVNGFDRSQRWEGGESHSIKQSHQQPLERRAGPSSASSGGEESRIA